MKKQSLRVLEGHEELQAAVTRQAMQFAQMLAIESRKKRLKEKSKNGK